MERHEFYEELAGEWDDNQGRRRGGGRRSEGAERGERGRRQGDGDSYDDDVIPSDGRSIDVAYDDDDAEERYCRCVDGLAKMGEEAADDVLLRPEMQRRRRSSFGWGGGKQIYPPSPDPGTKKVGEKRYIKEFYIIYI